ITITAQPFDEGGKEAHIVYVAGVREQQVELQTVFEKERKYWENTSQISSKEHKRISDLFTAAKYGLRAVVSSSGRFDSSIWQYGMEWGRDASMVAEALVYSGQFELARSVLQNILTNLANDEGMVAEASRFRGGKDSELDSNGLVLRALHTYCEWAGDDSLIKEHWKRIEAIADYLLRPEFLDKETGMLKASRDISERNEAMGIKQGYDVAHQTFGIIGLEAASKLAKSAAKKEDRVRWLTASEKMKSSFLSHPSHSMIENGKIIKRRLLDGTVQQELQVERKEENKEFFARFMPGGMPLAETGKHLLEPDTAQSFPIIYGIVDPKSEVARSTIEDLEKLWSQAWEGGGYGRYDVSGEPDSPGPWPLATCFMAQAYFEMEEHEMGMKALDWLTEKAGSGGSLFEFYGERPTPPLPPVGILPWAWAQCITLVVKNIVGAEVSGGKLKLSPKLDGIETKLRFKNE
ncbi:MAG: amylo-alpha-1,6-glucosidase, partial [Candidatus Kapaibacterium sp.]